jgi:hypothetical protein
MNVVRLPVASKANPQHERLAIMANALAHLDSVVAIYRQVGARPNPATILMMVAAILDEPELRKTAGLDVPGDLAGEDKAEPEPIAPAAETPPPELKNTG